MAVRTDVNGAWADIDTSVVEGAAGLEVVAPAFEMRFSDGTDPAEPLARIVKDGHELTFDVPFDLTDPVVDGSQVTYPGVLDGVDLIVTVAEDGTGFSEVLRVATPEAASHPELAQLSFPVATSDGLSVSAHDGGFQASDASGEQVFTSPTPLMWDSATPTAPDTAAGLFSPFSALRAPSAPFAAAAEPVTGDVSVEDRAVAPLVGDDVAPMPATVESDEVTITPDRDMIDDPETTWPIYIDPSVSGGLHERTLIRSGNPNVVAGYNWSGDAGLGLCDPGATSACSKWNDVHRLIFEYHGLSSIGALAGSDVISATFSAYGTHSWSCSATGVEAHWVTGITSATTWSNYNNSFSSLLQAQSVAHKPACSNDRWIEFDVTRLLRGTADGNYSTATIGLRASNEGSMAASWKRYRGDARLSITYNRAPSMPSALRTSNPDSTCVAGESRPYVRSATPTLHSTVSDPDPGATVRGNFEIRRASDHGLVWAGSSAYQVSGRGHSITVPTGKLSNGVMYRWWTSGTDESGVSGPANGGCEFIVDTLRPVRPVVGSGVFPDGVLGADVGTAGSFTFGPGGSSDVVAYKYSFGSDALDRTASVALGGSATVSFTPASAVPVTLSVQSVDRAGNTSDRVDYLIRPSVPAKVGFWSLDEGTGSVAGDQPGPGMTARPLTVSGGASWVPGAGPELDPTSSDKGLAFDGSTGGAASSGPVVATDKTFAVNAMVRTDVVDDQPRTVVSQDGQHASRFGLGIRTGSDCSAGAGSSCWAFWLNTQDTSAPARVVSASTIPVVENEWVSLTGVYDATSNTAQLWVCRPMEFEGPSPAGAVSAGAPWTALGVFTLGRAQAGGQPAQRWDGAISSVRAYASIPTDQQRYRDCNPLGS